MHEISSLNANKDNSLTFLIYYSQFCELFLFLYYVSYVTGLFFEGYL